jgi:hypothetical protein
MTEDKVAAPAEQGAGGSGGGTTTTRSTTRRRAPSRSGASGRSSDSGSPDTGAALDPNRDDPMQVGRRIWPD